MKLEWPSLQEFRRILVACEALDLAPGCLGERLADLLEQGIKLLERIQRKVFVPDQLKEFSPSVLVDGGVDDLPEESSLPDHIVRASCGGLDLQAKRLQMVGHQQRLVEEIVEVECPTEPLETAHDCHWMANDDDPLAVQPLYEPPDREDRQRVLDQQSAILDTPEPKAHPPSPNPNRVTGGAES